MSALVERLAVALSGKALHGIDDEACRAPAMEAYRHRLQERYLPLIAGMTDSEALDLVEMAEEPFFSLPVARRVDELYFGSLARAITVLQGRAHRMALALLETGTVSPALPVEKEAILAELERLAQEATGERAMQAFLDFARSEIELDLAAAGGEAHAVSLRLAKASPPVK